MGNKFNNRVVRTKQTKTKSLIMAKSKVRGGKKAHKAKVDARNQKLKSAQSAMQKLLKEAMQKEIEALKDNNEGETVHDTYSTENTKQ
jgi:hypothetical protein